MPTDTYEKRRRGSSSSVSEYWSSSSPRTRSRALAAFFVFIVFFLWFNHGGSSTPQSGIDSVGEGRNSPNYDAVNWHRFAYSQYATDGAHLCNSIMIFEALHRLGSRADRILFYPTEWDLEVSSPTDRDSQLLVMARDKYHVKLLPVNMESARTERNEEGDPMWDFGINMFHAWNATQYDRVLHLDSGVTLYKHLDELFFLPSAPVAMPRAYWKLPDKNDMSTVFVLLEPSEDVYTGLMRAAYSSELIHKVFDEEILNEKFWDEALVLPHQRYALLTSEFRRGPDDHRKYFGSYIQEWDPRKILEKVSLVKFEDLPLPKPWIMWPQALLPEIMPKCRVKPGTAEESGCQDREVWKELYNEYRQRRKDICRLLSIPAPEWPPKKGKKEKSKSKIDVYQPVSHPQQ